MPGAALAAPEQSPHEFLPAHAFGQSAAAEHNPHFSGMLRPLPVNVRYTD